MPQIPDTRCNLLRVQLFSNTYSAAVFLNTFSLFAASGWHDSVRHLTPSMWPATHRNMRISLMMRWF